MILGLFGLSTVELGGRSGNLPWLAPINVYRKTKFPRRKTRIAGISQSKFVLTVANDLRRKMRGWMRGKGAPSVCLFADISQGDANHRPCLIALNGFRCAPVTRRVI
jgi:hypothetical protein